MIVNSYHAKGKQAMKKLLTLACAAAVAASATLSISAAGIENWTAGNGYLIDDKNSPVTVTETDDGIQVSHGGYYVDGVNWGGIAYNEPVELDGFEIEIRIDKLPDTGTDTWFSVDFLQKPQLFQVGENYANNQGITNLIRWYGTDPFVESYGPEGWASCANDKNAAFGLAEGDTLTVSVADKDGKYVLTVNGVELTSAYDLSSICPDGTAYCVISCSMIDSPADGFQYTILSMNGEPVVTPDAVEEVTDDTTTAPATSDALIAVSALLVASAAGIVLVKKLRRA